MATVYSKSSKMAKMAMPSKTGGAGGGAMEKPMKTSGSGCCNSFSSSAKTAQSPPTDALAVRQRKQQAGVS